MNAQFKFYGMVLPILAFIAAFGCASQDSDVNDDSVEITSDETELLESVEELDEAVEIVSDTDATSAKLSYASSDSGLKRIAKISPPSVSKNRVHATSVHIDGSAITVSYNLPGDTYAGAIDRLQVLDSGKVQLNLRALMLSADVSSAIISGNTIYGAIARAESATVDVPATLMRLDLSLIRAGKYSVTSKYLPLASHAATSVAYLDGYAFVTSGSDGGLYVVDVSSMTVTDSRELDDARWVTVKDSKVVVAQGTPGRISIYDFSDGKLSDVAAFSFEGATTPESKSTVEISGDHLFIGAGVGGVQIHSLATQALVAALPLSALPGLDANVASANAVTVCDGWMFVSMEAAGIYALRVPDEVSDLASSDDLEVLGRLSFTNSNVIAVNHIACRNGILYVASGLDGLSVVTVKK